MVLIFFRCFVNISATSWSYPIHVNKKTKKKRGNKNDVIKSD